MNDLKIKNLRSKKYLLLSLFITLMFVSCGKREACLKFQELKSGKWAQQDTLVFVVDSINIDTTKTYQISVEITNNNTYKFSSLWLNLNSKVLDKDSLNTISKELILADKFGKWDGAGFGSLYQSSFIFADSILFPAKQDWYFTISQSMDDNPLEGIERIGLKVIEN